MPVWVAKDDLDGDVRVALAGEDLEDPRCPRHGAL
jgi:hypothetical protein